MWATQLKLPDETGSGEVEKEIWLWDFAGQDDYRLVHQLFMDETALAVLVFNPQSDNPFEGLGQWDRDLRGAARRPFKKLLVAGRCDRGGLMVSRESIEHFRQERNFANFLETSAYTGDGCDALRDAIISNICWNDIPWTASPRIFKLLKDEIVKFKDEGKALLRMGELKQQLEVRLSGETFTIEQLRAVIGLLVGPGIVRQLEFGDFILIQPERINAYAGAVIRKVRAHTEEIGVILEEDVLVGRLEYQGLKRLPPDEEQIVLRAMHQMFVEHGLCLREPTEAGTLLVFPSYFKRERPELEGHPAVFVTYQFNGRLNQIYSTLVVRLHHALALETHQLWRFAADFRTQAGKRVGLKMIKQGEGAAEIAVYFEPGVADDMKVTFIRYIHEHLQTKAQDVVRLRHYVCPHCHTPVENRKIAGERLDRGLKDIVCVNCEKRVPLWDLIEEKFASEEFQQHVRTLEQKARESIDNESKELILVGHAFAIAGEAGQIFRPTPNSDWGIDGEIEFKNDKGEASGKRVYLQLKSGDSYLQQRKADNKQIFSIKERHAEYWKSQAYPVMLVIRTSDGQTRWMNVSDYLNRHKTMVRQIVFEGESFTALNVLRLKDTLFR
jgi:GTPase SAR1 family protein